MNLPQLTSKIGKAAKAELGSSSELSMLVKSINIQPEKDYILFMTIDLNKQEIRFEAPTPCTENNTFHYHYFGNNSAAGMQYYLTREGSSIHYLLKSVFSDLYLVLRKHDLYKRELALILTEMNEQQLISLGNKKGTGKVNLDRIKGLSGAILDDKNNIVIDGVTRKSNDFIRYLLQWENKETNFALIIPRVVRGEEEPIILSQHPDYVLATKKEQNLEASSSKKRDEKTCYVCDQKSVDVSSELTTKFSRSGINKIFGTTTFNYAKRLDKKYYDDSYAICNACFQDLLFGEKKVAQSFSTQIAGERAFVLPEGLLDEFNYNRIKELKDGSDLFFEKGLAQELDDALATAMESFSNAEGYVVHFFLYRTDGNSVSVLNTIVDVPTIHIVRIVEMLAKQVNRLYPYIRSMSLGAIYRMIPVRTNKAGDQLDIQRVLAVYQALFTKTPMESNVLFEYAAEAIEKGYREIRKRKIPQQKKSTQYENLGHGSFLPEQEDRYFRQLTMRYLCLLQTCQEMGMLEGKVFQRKGVRLMDLSGMTSKVQEIEKFLKEQELNAVPRALFYLGVLLRSVAQAQYEKGHKSKPILNKISFQGMNQGEVIWLYQEILEKLNQYRKWTIENEQYMKAFNHYLGSFDKKKALTDQEHLFYIMAGYAFYPAKLSEKSSDTSSDIENLEEDLQSATV